MKKQVLFTILMLLPMVAMADDSGTCGDNLTWTYVESTKTLTISGTGDMKDYSSSSNVPWYWYSENMVNAIIDGGVTSIGDFAFFDCKSLTSINIPNSVKTIGVYAFHCCYGLTYIDIPNSVISIDYGAFYACSGLTSITIPEGVASIGDMAFFTCTNLTSITIPNSVTYIGSQTFDGCKMLSSIVIPNSVTYIGQLAFEDTEWYNNQPEGLVYAGNVAYKYKGSMPANTTIELKEETIGITMGAFLDCTGLVSVKMPNGLINIGDYAFGYCTGLTSIEIPNSVTTIGYLAFEKCTGLTTIEIPSSVSIIDYGAFWECFGLMGLIVKNETPPSPLFIKPWATEIANVASNNVLENCTLYVPTGCVDTYRETEYWGKFKNIEIIKYKLIYIVDECEYKIDYFEEGTPLNIESLSKEGYTFSGWSEIPETMPDHDVTITGSFVINKYKVTYIVDGTEYKTEDVEYGSVLKPNTPTKEGYTFSGWKNMPNTMPAHDVTVTGSFSINSYTLTYIVDGAEYKTASVEYGSVITPEVAPTKEGYTFNGWSEIPETMPAHDVKVTGTFSINKYEVTYMIDGVEYKKEEVEYGSEIKPDTLSKEGYSFSWIDLPKTMPAHDIIINGSFTINQYKVIFTVDGTEYQTIEVDYGADVNPIEEPTKIGYTFSGWSDIPDTMPAHDVVINGNFSVNYYTISYVVNDNIYMTDSVAYGTEAIPIDGPEREGYTFIGWTGFPTTMPAHDVIAIGFYTVNSYKVTFVYGDSVLTTIEVNYGETIELPTSLNSERYTLVNWMDVPQTMPAHDIIIYADYVDGINDIAADSRDAQYIQLNGMYTTELKPGLNIIRMKDGTTKKVWVK